jgi:hypothetical protein
MFVMVLGYTGLYSDVVLSFWSQAFMWALIIDLVLIQGVLIAVNMVIVKKLGKSPTACGKNRNFWYFLAADGIKKTVR